MLDRAREGLKRAQQRPIVRRARSVLGRYGEDRGDVYASALTYQAFLSLFPLLLLAMSIIGFVVSSRPSLADEWSGALQRSIPGLGTLLGGQLSTLARNRASVGVVGLAGLAWTGTSLIEASGDALNAIFRIKPSLSFFRRKAWAIGSLAGLGALALLSIGLAGALGAISGHGALAFVTWAVGVLVGVALDAGLFLVSYRMLSHREGPSLRELWPGALVAGAGWSLLKLIGTWYAARTVAGSALVYGTFAATVGMLVILSLSARLFLYGAVLSVTRFGKEPEAGSRPTEHPSLQPNAPDRRAEEPQRSARRAS